MNPRKRLPVETSLNARSCLFVLSLLPLLSAGCTSRNNYQSSLYEIEPERIPSFDALDTKPAVAIILCEIPDNIMSFRDGSFNR